MGFHGRTSACKPHITKYYAKFQMEWYKAHATGLEQWKCVLWSDESHFTVWQSDE